MQKTLDCRFDQSCVEVLVFDGLFGDIQIRIGEPETAGIVILTPNQFRTLRTAIRRYDKKKRESNDD